MIAPVAPVAPGRTLSELAELMLTGSRPDEPAWRATARRDAAAWIGRHGFPDKRHEDWRYVDLQPLLSLPFTPAGPVTGLTPGGLAAGAGPSLGGPRLVVVNGRFDPRLSTGVGVPVGVRVSSPAGEIEQAGRAGYVHAFEALNAALAASTLRLEIADATVVEAPIEIVYLTVSSGDMPVAHPRTEVVAGSGSSVTIVETYLGTGEGPSLTNAHTRVIVGSGARVQHYKLQDEPDEAFHLSRLQVEPAPDAVFASHLLAVGAGLGRHEVHVRLAAEGARADLDGLYLTGRDQRHDNPVLVEHLAAGCASWQLYKGIVGGAGHGIFNGRVVVHPGATGTDAHQTNKNLLLSDRAEVDTRPRLEIFSDDVSCTHGAAVGQLDPDGLFYLRSRGIPEPAARGLLISGFANEVLDRYATGPVRERAQRIVGGRLAETEQLV